MEEGSFGPQSIMCSDSQAGSYLRLTDSCITQIKDEGLSRACNESKEKEEESIEAQWPSAPPALRAAPTPGGTFNLSIRWRYTTLGG